MTTKQKEKAREKKPAENFTPDSDKILSENEIAVIINQNARKVSKRLQHTIEKLGPYVHVYYTKTVDEARYYCRRIVADGFPSIFSAGGDGSLTNLINLLKEAIDEYEQSREKGAANASMPSIGILKYGTGNGIASFLGTKKGLKNIRTVARDGHDKFTKINLIESSGKLFPFSGIGLDAKVLNDFKYISSLFGGSRIWKKISGGIIGYFLTTFGYSAPRLLLDKPTEVEVINTGDEVYSISYGQSGQRRKIKHGETIYRGKTVLTAAATVPNYGYGLKAFPFAFEKEGFMNLRIINMSTPKIVFNAPKIWNGKIKDKGFVDFLVQSVKINLDRPMPYQISGDAAGVVSTVDYKVSDLTVKLYNFNKQKKLPLGKTS